MFTQLNGQTVLFLWIQFSNQVKKFQVSLSITNDSSRDQWFIYTKLNDQTVLFITIQTVVFDSYTGPYQALLLQARVDLETMTMKGTLQSFRNPGPTQLDCLVSNAGHSSGRGVLPLCRDAVDVF